MAGYDQSRLIYLALLKLNAIDAGGTPTTTQTDDATDALDDIVQELQADGIRLWAQEDVTIALVASQAQYQLGPGGTGTRPLRVISAVLKNKTTNDTVPMVQYSRWDWNMLGNLAQTGQPNAFYYDPQLTNGLLNVYNPPDATAATTYEIVATVQSPLAAITYSTTALSFPNEWFQFLKWALAAELITEYGYPLQEGQYIIQRAAQYREKLEAWDQEEASTYFTSVRSRGQ